MPARLRGFEIEGRAPLLDGPWQLDATGTLGGVQLRHAAQQDRVPATDIPTAAASIVDLWASWRQALGDDADALGCLELNKLGDALACNASTVRNARELAPATARALQAGVRLSF